MGKKQKEVQKLPDYFKPILWSYDFSSLSVVKDKKQIIINTINYGDLKHWRWMYRKYGKQMIQEVSKNIPITTLRPRARRLASLIFSIKTFSHAPRGIK